MLKQKDKKIKTAALYIRVSTDAQREEGYSIDAQKEMLEAYCTSRQIKHYSFYIDGGFSGSNTDRPELQRLINDVKNYEVSCVVVYKLDRLSRSQKDTLYLIEDVFNPAETDFVSLNENMDTSTPIGRAMLGIMSAFAQLERETIRERTRIGMRERVKSGLWMGGGKIPFGYDYDREKGILIPNSDADKVKKLYNLYIRGWSFARIASALDLKYERLAEQILLRKTNTGIILYNGVEYKGQHEAIIDKQTYDNAIALYLKRSKKGLITSKSLLAGLIICGVCGSKMRYQKWGKNGYKIYCYSQDIGKKNLFSGECDNNKTWADEIEDIIIKDLFSAASKKIDENINAAADDYNLDLKKRFDVISKKIKTLYNLYAQSEDELLIETIEENKTELEKIKALLEDENKTLNEYKKSRETAKEITNLKEAWEYMTTEEKQSILRRCIDKVVITYEKVDIYYMF